jgi:hypothetical protein
MEGNMANDDLEALKQTRDAKFDEICSLLAFAYGEDPDPDNLSDARKINQIVEEAEQLLKRTTVLGNWGVVTKTKLQRLVAEHHETSKHISRRIRTAHQALVEEISALRIVSWLATTVKSAPAPQAERPEEVHLNGHAPLGGFGAASWAPWDGTQYEPLVKYPCGHEPPELDAVMGPCTPQLISK